jgi:hypothetical protein
LASLFLSFLWSVSFCHSFGQSFLPFPRSLSLFVSSISQSYLPFLLSCPLLTPLSFLLVGLSLLPSP